MTRRKDDLDTKIIALWAKGHSGGDIGAVVGLTRSAVMGRIHRLRKAGVLGEGRDIISDSDRKAAAARTMDRLKKQAEERARRAEWKKRPPPPRKPYAPPSAPAKKRKLNASFWDLQRGQCKYIVSGDGIETYVFCGAEATKRVYCAEHHALCYVPARPREDRRKVEFIIKKANAA